MTNSTNYTKKATTYTKKAKPTPIHLQQVFTNMTDAIVALMKLHPEIAAIFTSEDKPEVFRSTQTDSLTVDDATDEVTKYFAYDCLPQLTNKHNIHCTLSVTANKAFIRTESGIAFGWEVKYIVENRVATVETVTALFSIYNGDEAISLAAKEVGFEDKPRYRAN